MWNNKLKAVTFSYDDGVTQDIKLIEMFDKYGLKATFNLNSGFLDYVDTSGRKDPRSTVKAKEVAQIYKNHEVASHTFTHPYLTTLSDNDILHQITEDQKNLSQLLGYDIIGMAYPGGMYDKRVKDVITKSGLLYCRTVNQTENFEIPTDFMEVNPTCRHKNPKLLQLAEEFVNLKTDKPQLFYLWGHSYEFDVDKNWDMFEEFCRIISGKDDIYYCTNIEAFSPFFK